MVSRFPALNVYRSLLLLVAFLVLVGGSITSITGARVTTFGTLAFSGPSRYDSLLQLPFNPFWFIYFGSLMGGFLVTLVVAFSVLMIAESVKLILNMEDHLYNMRNPDKLLADMRRARRTRETQKQIADQLRKQGSVVASRSVDVVAKTAKQAAVAAESARERLAESHPTPVTQKALPPANNLPKTGLLSNAPPQDKQAFEAFKRGYTYYKAENFDMAVPEFTTVIEREPTYAEAYRYRALCYSKLGEQDAYVADRARYEELVMEV